MTIAYFFYVRSEIISCIEKNHGDIYKKLFVTLENTGTEIDETFLWRDFTAEGYKKLNDEYLSKLMRRYNTLGLMLVFLFILFMLSLGLENYYISSQ